MGRPSLLLTRVTKQGGAVTSVHVGGSCVKMMEGTLNCGGRGRLDEMKLGWIVFDRGLGRPLSAPGRRA